MIEAVNPYQGVIFYEECDATIWAVYEDGTSMFLLPTNCGQWQWFKGSSHYANTMSAELLFEIN